MSYTHRNALGWVIHRVNFTFEWTIPLIYGSHLLALNNWFKSEDSSLTLDEFPLFSAIFPLTSWCRGQMHPLYHPVHCERQKVGWIQHRPLFCLYWSCHYLCPRSSYISHHAQWKSLWKKYSHLLQKDLMTIRSILIIRKEKSPRKYNWILT